MSSHVTYKLQIVSFFVQKVDLKKMIFNASLKIVIFKR